MADPREPDTRPGPEDAAPTACGPGDEITRSLTPSDNSRPEGEVQRAERHAAETEPQTPDALGQGREAKAEGPGAGAFSPLAPRPSPLTESGPITQLPCAFGDYELLEELAHGGMGVIYKARQSKLHRTVALKMIRAGHWATEHDVQRFYLEAKASARLDHPGIVSIFEVGAQGGQHFYSMALVEGGSLAVRLRKGPLPPREAASLVARVADAVAYAHQHGVVHRDLKPGNILLDAGGQPKVTDFGLAKVVATDSHLTISGQVLGTPSYMAPEQASGKLNAVGPLADVYSLGGTLYCLLTGRPPFQAATMMETIKQVLEREPVAVRQLNPAVARDLETICHKCLQKEPDKRYSGARQLGDDLRRYLAGEPIQARPVGRGERLWRWCRRNRTIAALIATVALVLVAGTAVSWYFAIRAMQGETQATANAFRAHAAQRLSERRLYSSRINLSKQALAQGQIDLVEQWLQQLRPSDGGEDLRGFEWHYLQRLCHQELWTFHGHEAPVWSVALSPNGRYVASAGGKRGAKRGEVILWDVITGRFVWRRPTLAGTPWNVAFSPDGSRVAAASGLLVSNADHYHPGGLGVWDVASGKELWTQPTAQPLGRVAFSPDGRHLATMASDDAIALWDASTGQPGPALHGHDASFYCLAFSRPDGRYLAFAEGQHPVTGEPARIRIWDWAQQRQVGTLPLGAASSEQINALAYSPDGRWLAAAVVEDGAPAEVRIWDTASGKQIARLQGHTGAVRGLAFSPDSRRLASAADDHMVRVWDVASGRALLALRGLRQPVFGVAFGPQGRRLASASGDGTVKLWDTTRLPEPMPLRGHSGAVWTVAYSPNGRYLVSTGSDQTVRLWDATTGRQSGPAVRGSSAALFAAAFSRDGKQFAAAGEDSRVRVWDTDTRHLLFERAGLPGGTAAACLAFSPTGDRLAMASRGRDGTPVPQQGGVRIWDSATGRVVLTLHTPDHLHALAYSPDGRWLATGGDLKTIAIWDATTGAVATTLHGHEDPVWALAFSPDGRLLAAGDQGGKVKLWPINPDNPAADSGPPLSLPGHIGRVFRVAFSPDGRRLASASGGYNQGNVFLKGEVILWDVPTGEELLRLGDVRGWITCVAFSPDGLHLATAAWQDDPDRRLMIWDATEYRPEARPRREAWSLVHFLFGQRLSRAQVIERLRADRTIGEPARQVALALAADYPMDPLGIADARQVVERPGQTGSTYRLAYEQALAACRYDSSNGTYMATLGMAAYRQRAPDWYQKALTTLKRAEQLDARQKQATPPANFAFVAMAEYQLGHHAEAQAALQRGRDALRQPRWKNDHASQALLHEAAGVIGRAR